MTVSLQLGTASVELEGNMRVVAGRDGTACALSHQHPTLSRRHAEVWLSEGQPFIRDLGSANGTWIDGQPVGKDGVALAPGQQVWLGHLPLGVTWKSGQSTSMAAQVPADIAEKIETRRSQMMAAPQPFASTPMPSEYAYRKQGSNANGVLLLALKQDTHWSGANLDGYVEFTALDTETVASIAVELVETHRRRSALGQTWDKEHVWDRVLVRQGPWRAQHNDVLPLPFSLRVPAGTAMSNKEVSWEIRGMVDINWAVDIDAAIPITMRNPDIERLRDAMGAMDYRVEDIEAAPGGQRFVGTFAPPAQLAAGVNAVTLEIDYLGANLKVRMKLDKKGLHRDPVVDQIFELGRFRAATQPEVNVTLQQMLAPLLA